MPLYARFSIIQINDREPILQIAAIKMASKMAARAFSRCNKAQWEERIATQWTQYFQYLER